MAPRNTSDGELPLLLAALPPSTRQRRFAWTILAVFLATFAITVPFANTPLPRMDSWVPSFTTALVITDLVTAALLFSQYSIARQPGLLILATGYLFSALIIIPYALTFPGVYAPTGLLGAGLQSAVWFYIVWHIASPLSVILYELFKSTGTQSTRARGWLRHRAECGSHAQHRVRAGVAFHRPARPVTQNLSRRESPGAPCENRGRANFADQRRCVRTAVDSRDFDSRSLANGHGLCVGPGNNAQRADTD